MNVFFPKFNRLRLLIALILFFLIFLFIYSKSFIDQRELDIPDTSNPKLIPNQSPVKPNNVLPEPVNWENSSPRIFSENEKGNADKVKQEIVKQMMLHAWNGYKKKAWGCHEVNTQTGGCNNPSYLGPVSGLGVSIVDAIDTLFIMRLDKEVAEAKEFIRKLNFARFTDVSLFEYNIRYLGSFLTMYSFTKEQIYLDKGKEIANILSSAFYSQTGFPRSLINLKTGDSYPHSWATGGCAIAAEFGTLQMEWQYLSELTGDPTYAEKVKKIRQTILKLERAGGGLFYNYYNFESGSPCTRSSSFGGLGDSLYEYFLKEHIRTNGADKDGRRLYDESIKAMVDLRMYATSERSKSNYIGNYEFGTVTKSMEHLTCFAGGLLMLGANGVTSDINFQRGINITATCRKSYTSSIVGLGPETFHFTHELDAVSNIQSSKKYLLRPEVVESYFYAWRYTKDPKYRVWAWEMVQALEKYCKTEYGFSGLLDVYDGQSRRDNVQQSFFLAETMKYLYLIFSDDETLSLRDWTFNTEAHPFPINKKENNLL